MSRASQVAVLRTRPETVIEDYGRLLRLVKYDQVVPRDQDLILKLNLSWTKYFPACSTQPWQLDGVLTTLLADGYDRRRLLPVENRTVVTDPVQGCRNNKWDGVLRRHGLPFIPLTEVEWTVHRFRTPLLRLHQIFPDGIEIPAMYVGRNVLHLPTVKCVHPDTEILLADGRLVRAEALVKEWQVREPTRELPDGDRVSEGEVRVVSLGGEGLREASATHFWRTPAGDPDAWTVTTRTGRAVTTSARHLFLTPEGWTPACRLRPGDRVAIARHVRIAGASQPLPRVGARAPERTSADFWRWMGYFTAEGYAGESRGSYRISITNPDPEVRRDYLALSRSLFGVEPRTRGNEISFEAANLRPFFEALGFPAPTRAATKEVPPLLFACPDDEIAAFVQGYLDGDGTVDARTGVYAVTKSRRLASQIQTLLARLGVVAFVRTVSSRATNGRRPEKVPYAGIAVYGDDVVTLASRIRLRCEHKQRALQALVARRRAGRRPSHWDTIPVPPALFRMIRQGLGFTQASTGRPSSANNIENGYTEPVRPVVRYFAELFERADFTGRFSGAIAYLRFLASEDMAWDRVAAVRVDPVDVPFFYDLSVEGTPAFVANGLVLHNTHGHSVTTGAIKNAFGGLLKEVRHYAHEFMHEVLVDLMLMQRELHPAVLAVMDGTVMGDGAGPRTMVPRVGNLLLASADQVAIDAVAARIMGFDPLTIPYLRMCHERGLGTADPRDIEIVGDPEAAAVSLGFRTKRSLVIWGDQLIRRGPLRPLKRLLLHSPLVVWAPFASNVYHDLLWYPTVGRARIRAFAATPWGRLFARY
ncbi:MAG TPA: LAGLIDADG family homing endonuclease [Candidatus Binatia bacterium]|nr:LAGLIDADG family homing endonuclease [Candidatus Binatia bacterium]